ncbi:MAG: UDP-N-acetylglucosamine--N-acetylmuramyl-(pentapeptide) pyrophosphoryl-undecaprenol N-acetylglucosamine transferase [Deltaproteobacteria bacterium]|nr:UDP-N-acetylglucosamine--N-acetylmuramyl-(pentapeptide) pyrophosphoryl-undecaprenol N-acetylglucosamine transferase [Deltaproteobacteria bacterium]
MPKPLSSAPLHVLLAGGGSGGHVFPALTLADELQERGHQVTFAGSSQGLEARLVTARDIPFHALAARPLVGQGVFGKAKAVATLGLSAVAARSLVRRLGVRAVVGTGGYVSAPALVGARLASLPVLLLEPNARSGVANRWLSRLAAEAAVAYEQTSQEFACPSLVTGVPVRQVFFETPGLEEAPAVPRPPRLLVLGGSQGALQLNQALPEAVVEAAKVLGGLEITHQCGERHLAVTQQAYDDAVRSAGSPPPGQAESGQVSSEAGDFGQGVVDRGPLVKVVPFLEDMAGAMGQSDLIISRAGAVTLAEICAAGRPSLLVPLAGALGHQLDNGRVLETAGAAQVLLPEQVERNFLAESLAKLLGDRSKLVSMGSCARSLARRDSATLIADRVEALAGFERGEG